MAINQVMETAGSIAYAFSQVQPYILPFTFLILSAVIPIWAGAHASLVLPSTAGTPDKSSKLRPWHESKEDSEHEKQTQLEGFAPIDAILFPIAAGGMLTALYYGLKYIDASTINILINLYVSISGLYSVANFLVDISLVTHSYVFPTYYVYHGQFYQFDSLDRKAIPETGVGPQTDQQARESPFPGILSSIALPKAASQVFWFIREIPHKRWTLTCSLRGVTSLKFSFNLYQLIAVGLSFSGWAYWNLIDKPWWLGNLAGYAAVYTAIELLVPNSFLTGTLVLGGLFVYDIIMVFYTPMMITVATSIDAPLMLHIPKASENNVRQFSILGLGDIVIPGMMLGLALRFDQWIYYLRRQTPLTAGDDANTTVTKAPYVSVSKHWGNRFWIWLACECTPPWSTSKTLAHRSALVKAWLEETIFPKRYFTAGVIGYAIGLAVTQIVVDKFQRGQPALLYLVPGVLGALWGTALARGELKELCAYTDEVETPAMDQQQVSTGAGSQSTSRGGWFANSFFSEAKTERNARKLGLHSESERPSGKDDDTINAGPDQAVSRDDAHGKKWVEFGLESPYRFRECSREKKEPEVQTMETGEPAEKRQRVK